MARNEETPRQILFALCWRGGDGSLDKIRALYDSKKVKKDEVDDNNVTALRFAAQYNHPEIVRYLLDIGSSTKIKAKGGIQRKEKASKSWTLFLKLTFPETFFLNSLCIPERTVLIPCSAP